MNNKLKLLLQLIKEEADTSFLLKQGLSYSQIAALFAEGLKNELIRQEGRTVSLTEKGFSYLAESEVGNRGRDRPQWIFPDESYMIQPLAIDEIYLPTKKDVKFLET